MTDTKMNILCIGDIILDTYVHCESNRLSSEAPVPILKIQNKDKHLGGISSIAAMLASSKNHVTLLGSVGNDAAGFTILRFLEKYADIEAYIFTDKLKKTTSKKRYICDGQQLLRVDDEVSIYSEPCEVSLLSILHQMQKQFDIIVISDYNYGLLTDKIVQDLVNWYDTPILVYTRNPDIDKYARADLIVIDADTLALCTKNSAHSKTVVEMAHDALINFDLGRLMVTRKNIGPKVYGPILVSSDYDQDLVKYFEPDHFNKESVLGSKADNIIVSAIVESALSKQVSDLANL